MDSIMNYIRLLALTSLCLACFSSPTQALTSEQKLYLSAVEAARNQRSGEARALQRRLGGYPLALYIDYYDLMAAPSFSRLAEASRFISQHRESYLANRLERRYLLLLASESRWSSFLSFYPREPASPDLRCYYYLAKYATGERALAFKAAESLWLEGRPQPGDCNSLFSAWKQAGHLSDEKVWRRGVLAFEAGSDSLVRYLATQFSREDWREFGKRMLSLYESPAQLTRVLAPSKDQRTRALARLALQRLASQDAATALRLYPQAQQRYQLTEADLKVVKMALARRLMLDRESQHRGWLDQSLSEHADLPLLELRVRLAIWESDWASVRRWIYRMPKAGRERDDVQWTYWLARAEEESGRRQHARALYQQASFERSYYGFLAAQRAGKRLPLNQARLNAKLEWPSASLRWPALARIRELLALRETDLARAEWLYLLEQVSTADKLQLGGLALQQGWHDLAVQASIAAKARNVLSLRFPTPWLSTFSEFAEARRLQSSLLYAVARQESALYPKAQSPVGASGLMQLMPQTASHTAKRIGFAYQGTRQLTDPEVNVRLGSAYLQELMELYGGNRVLSIAAYNAGPGRVRKWRRESGGKPMDVWIESIPYRETRNYVQNVLVYNVIYQSRLRQPLDFLSLQERSLSY